MMRNKLLIMAFGEFIGSFLLVFWGIAAVTTAVLFEAYSGLLQVALIWGLAVTFAIYATRHFSCAHLNPAVSLAMVLAGRMKWSYLPVYWLAQLCGAIGAGLLLLFIFHSQIAAFEATHHITRGAIESVKSAMLFGEYFPNPGFSSIPFDVDMHTGMIVEGFGTFLLVSIILIFTQSCNVGKPSDGITPILIGGTVAAIIAIFAPLTQAGINPARDFGPRLVAYFAGWNTIAIPGPKGGFFLVYILAPLIGGSVAALFSRYIIEIFLKNRNQWPDNC